MAVRKNKPKVEDKKVISQKVVKPKTVKKPKLVTEGHELIVDVPVTTENGLEILKKGTVKQLTKEGAKYFKQKNYIK
jgi:hypothetical protein